jgi:AbrB family looped-hinge helix DNA binding protein
MERIITSMDQHGRMLIPSSVREKFNMHPGEKVAMEINDNEIKIINADYVIDEMYKLFTKNKTDKNVSIVDDFNDKKHQEFLIEEARSKKNV